MSLATTVPVALRWADMDAYGHVNNVLFLRLLEEARIAGIRSWFDNGLAALNEGIVVSRHQIEYRAPLVYRPDPVVVELWVTAVGAAGFDVGYRVHDPDGPLYALAETGLALYDFAAARPRRLKPADRAALAERIGEPVPFRRR